MAHSLRHGDIVPISQEGAELIATMTTTASRPTLMGTATDDPLSLLAKEWLVTNGIGGYASGSLLGVATRRYHGLFVPDLPGRGRTLLIPRLDETVDQGTGMALLSGAEYADGRIEVEPADAVPGNAWREDPDVITAILVAAAKRRPAGSGR